MTRRIAQIAALMIAVSSLVGACGYSPTNPSNAYTGPVAVQGVKVTPQQIQLSAIGETKDLVATIFPANATDQAVTWDSSDPKVVSVDAKGRITALAAGAGIFITVTTHDGRYEASVNVSVNQ